MSKSCDTTADGNNEMLLCVVLCFVLSVAVARDEFLQRRREAHQYKVRAQKQLVRDKKTRSFHYITVHIKTLI